MSTPIQHKRVEFTELFYDLVFVYAISKTTGLIHHLEDGMVSPMHFLTFIIALLLMVNTWMFQTVFTNRYGRNSLLNMSVMFIDMGFLMYLSNSFTVDWQANFHHFALAFGLLSSTLLFQYVVQYFQSTEEKDKELTQSFIYMLAARSIGVIVASFLPYNIGIWLYYVAFIGTYILPFLFRHRMNSVPVNFPHLVERISLLVIITFGEMIVGVASFFQEGAVGLQSVLFLLMVVLLFLLYFGEFDHALDESIETQGVGLIYSHYFIFIGILMTTVSMTFLTELHEAYPLFVIAFLYIGLYLILSAILWNGRYNKPAYQWTPAYRIIFWGIFAAGLLLSLLMASSFMAVTLVTSLMLLAIWIHFILFYTKNHRISNDPHEIHFL